MMYSNRQRARDGRSGGLMLWLKGCDMAELTTKKRNALPDSTFALPDRRFPVNDAAHAANAKARATQAVNAGRMSESTKEKIDAKANAKLGDSGKSEDAPRPPKRWPYRTAWGGGQ
jgi:hypothetical protein